ncbi:MAG: inosine/xanthosine triphosphatase [bacterium]|nr:inosine/xanthosine triphosphatase [bacterium]
MKKIIIASKNPVKINATLNGFRKMFPNEQFEIEGVSVLSEVSDQPKSDSETFRGAWNRADNAYKENPNADFCVGIEGGIEEKNKDTEAFAWVVIKAKDGGLGKARTSTFFLPPQITELIKQGKELGEADDMVFGRTNSKQENGAVGILTDNVADRTKYYTEAVVLALIPFKNKKLYNL